MAAHEDVLKVFPRITIREISSIKRIVESHNLAVTMILNNVVAKQRRLETLLEQVVQQWQQELPQPQQQLLRQQLPQLSQQQQQPPQCIKSIPNTGYSCYRLSAILKVKLKSFHHFLSMALTTCVINVMCAG